MVGANDVQVDGNIIGTVSGYGTADMLITFNNLATDTRIETLMQAIAFSSTSDNPGTSRTATVTFNDGGNTGAGGPLSDVETVTINVVATNDAPINLVPASIAVTEDTTTKLLAIQISDVDAGGGNVTVTLSIPGGSGALSAVGIAGVIVGGCGTASLTLTGTVAAINTFLSTPAQSVTYNPVGNSTADVTLTVTTNDNGNSGTGGALSDTDNVTLDLIPANDAPVLANVAVPAVTATEDSLAPSGAVGTLVSSLVDLTGGGGLNNVSDVDPSPVTGIAVTATAAAALGTTPPTAARIGPPWALWRPTMRCCWRPMPARGSTSSRPRSTSTARSATPSRSRPGIRPAARPATKVDTTVSGGTTAFSTATDTADVTVSAVNDAPVLALNTAGTYRDEFGTTNYNNSSGTVSWTADSWTETNDTSAGTGGDIEITGGRLSFQDGIDGDEIITREVDLTGATAATLTFTWEDDDVDSGENVIVEAFNGTIWDLLGTLTGASADDTVFNFSANLTPAQIGAHSAIRFRAEGTWTAARISSSTTSISRSRPQQQPTSRQATPRTGRQFRLPQAVLGLPTLKAPRWLRRPSC